MNWFSLLMVAISVSIDGFWGGFAFGLKRVKVPWNSLLYISGLSVIACSITMVAGAQFAKLLAAETAKWVGAAMLIAIGIWAGWSAWTERDTLGSHYSTADKGLFVRHRSCIALREGVALGISVAIDASGAAFALGVAGFGTIFIPFLMGITHYVLIGWGNMLALERRINTAAERFYYLPACILILIGILRLI